VFVHSHECQKIQNKNPFGEILGLGFDLGHLKMNIYYFKKKFSTDYKNIHIKKLMGKIN
jgi:hypothetical protein